MKSLRIRQIIIITAIATVFALPLAAQNELSVKCVDTTGKPVAGAKVYVIMPPPGDQKQKDKKSNRQGMANFDKLEDGLYRVFSHKDGFAPALFEFVMLKGGATESVTLTFAKGGDRSLYFEDPSINDTANNLLMDGFKALQVNDFPAAEERLRQALGVNPSNPEALYNLAIATIRQNKWDAATEALEHSARTAKLQGEFINMVSPGMKNPYPAIQKRAEDLLVQLPSMRLKIEAGEALAKGNLDEAIAMYKESLEHDPNDPDTHYNLALASARMENFDDALKYIEPALKIYPNEADYVKLENDVLQLKQLKGQDFAEQGNKLFAEGNYAGALEKYNEALPFYMEKNHPAVLVVIARTYDKMGQQDQALAAFRRTVEMAPENAELRNELAQYYFKLKQYDEALDLYTSGAAGSGSADEALFKIGKEQSAQGNTEVAKLAFEKAIETNPANAEAYYQLAVIFYFSKEDDEKAKELFKKYLEIGKNQGNIDNANNMLVVIERRTPSPQ